MNSSAVKSGSNAINPDCVAYNLLRLTREADGLRGLVYNEKSAAAC